MFFNPKKREEKKRIKEERLKSQQKADQLAQQIEAETQAIESQKSLLTKDLKGTESETKGVFSSLKRGLSKTKGIFSHSILSLSSHDAIDEEFLENLEERLLASDIGVTTSMRIMDHLHDQIRTAVIQTQSEAIEKLTSVIAHIMDAGEKALPTAQVGPTVYLFVGVNGAGKTTSIGKLAAQFKGQGKKVLVAAGDTFRAAAIEQLKHWCDQIGVDCIAKTQGSDPSATLFEAASKAKEEHYDILLCDTSGRLQNKKYLMDELSKMKRSIQKVIPTAPHASLLVIDANTGQNAISQTKEFTQTIDLQGLIVTKLDGTAKGGVVIGIVNEFDTPVYYIGIGEKVEDLRPFSPREFASSLFEGQ